jgi:hypothetical protein
VQLYAERSEEPIVPNEMLLKAFADAKLAVTNAATLVTEDRTKELVLSTDASLTGLGFTLGEAKDQFRHVPTAQLTESQLEVIRYGSVAVKSHTLTHASPTMRELAGVVFAIKKCYNQLQGRRFTIFTDHSALVHLFNACTTDHKLQRWADILMSLDFQVVHIRGIHNTRPDALSRLEMAAISHINQIGLSRDQIIRNKSTPGSRTENLKMIEETHEYGNFGMQAIFMKIWHNGFCWPQIRDDIKALVDDCVACQRVNVQRHGYHPLISISARSQWITCR